MPGMAMSGLREATPPENAGNQIKLDPAKKNDRMCGVNGK